ncbi:MAG: sigma-70 family RNA polymerase sigma factor [Bacteroidales bacterium]|nr:sigma-70 family RNA polymerase sigma factor [Bacteroidales bacterium]
MSRKFKTSKKNRINYIYYDSNGIKTVLIPGEDGVNEATIEILHQFDDEEVNNNRRETRRHSSIDEINDKSKYIKDLYVDVEEEALSKIESEATEKIVQDTLLELKPQQRDLINKLYLSDNPMTQAEYAEELGIEESSVSQKAWRARTKIKKIIENKNIF